MLPARLAGWVAVASVILALSAGSVLESVLPGGISDAIPVKKEALVRPVVALCNTVATTRLMVSNMERGVVACSAESIWYHDQLSASVVKLRASWILIYPHYVARDRFNEI